MVEATASELPGFELGLHLVTDGKHKKSIGGYVLLGVGLYTFWYNKEKRTPTQ